MDRAFFVLPVLTLFWAAPAMADDLFFIAHPLTEVKSFTPGIEGPVGDLRGNVYAVNYARQQTIGRVSPDGRAESFVTLPGESVGNGLRFDQRGTLFVADYVGHNILRIDVSTRQVTVLAHEPRMNQPNDLAITAEGVIFASDPNWEKGTGQLWRIDRDGSTTRLAEGMGTANGIAVAPDDRTLYVNESEQRRVWAFRLTSEKTLADKRLIHEFPDYGLDGMRTDIQGNLYIARYGKGVVAVLSPEGEVLREIDVLGKKPSNLCFGGPDGRTVFVTEVEKQRIVCFRVDQPGLDWSRRHHARTEQKSAPAQ